MKLFAAIIDLVKKLANRTKVYIAPTRLDNHTEYGNWAKELLINNHIQADILVVDKLMGSVAFVTSKAQHSLLQLDGIGLKQESTLVIERAPFMEQLQVMKGFAAFSDITEEQLFEVIIAHEMGHLYMNHPHSEDIDYRKDLAARIGNDIPNNLDLFKELGEYIIKAEVEAWQAGRMFISPSLAAWYEDFNSISLKNYKNGFNKGAGTVLFEL